MLARCEALLRSPRVRVAGALLCLAIFGLIVVRLVGLWRDGALDLTGAHWPAVIAALVVHGAAVTAFGAVWPHAVRALGASPPRGLLPAFYVGQLAKYLPGGAWQYLGRAGLAVRLGLPLRVAAGSLGIETVCALVALAPLAPLALATGGDHALLALALSAGALLAIGLAARMPWGRCALRALLGRMAGAEMEVSPPAVRDATVRYLGAWVVFGVGFWLVGAALVGASFSHLPLYVGVFVIAWAVGFVVFFAPGGVGVREAVIIGLLGPRIGGAEALLVATASRVAFTVVDVVGGVVALWLLRRVRRGVPLPTIPDAGPSR